MMKVQEEGWELVRGGHSAAVLQRETSPLVARQRAAVDVPAQAKAMAKTEPVFVA